MQCCKEHWNMYRQAIEDKGMSSLVARNSEEAFANIKVELEGGQPPFDPLMSMNWHWAENALKFGGLYLVGLDPEGKQYCPICEFSKNYKDWDAKQSIESVAAQMADYCREEGLIPRHA